jgi:hypothetical protein
MAAREACYLTFVGRKDTAVGWCIVSLAVAAAIITRIVVDIGEGLVCHGREAWLPTAGEKVGEGVQVGVTTDEQ